MRNGSFLVPVESNSLSADWSSKFIEASFNFHNKKMLFIHIVISPSNEQFSTTKLSSSSWRAAEASWVGPGNSPGQKLNMHPQIFVLVSILLLPIVRHRPQGKERTCTLTQWHLTMETNESVKICLPSVATLRAPLVHSWPRY